MARFATEFPVSLEMNQDKFCTFIKEWLIKSKNSKFTKDLFQNNLFFEINKTNKWELGHEELSYTSVKKENFSGITIQYIKHETNITFITELTFTEAQNQKWISCQITNSAKKANISLPDIKKPHIINQIISNSLGGKLGMDIKEEPYYFKNEDIDLAAELINGDLDCRLPIIYISVYKNKKYLLSKNSIAELAKELSGIAHVVVEPNRDFSLELSELTNNLNVFKGYIGIYWANGDGRNIIFTNRDLDNLYEDIKKTIISAVSNRRPLEICNGNFVKNHFNIYQERKSSETNELLELSMQEAKELELINKKLTQENNFLKEEKTKAEEEINRLKENLKSSNKSILYTDSINTIILNCTEKDLYPNEINDMILTILKESIDMNAALERRKHILESILENNPMQGKGGELREKIKSVLKGYTNLDKKIRNQLEDIGFKIEEGTHYKVRFKDDPRYSFVLTKSGSDSKSGGLNAATDFCTKKLGLK